jgi:hypothetical protein
MIAVVSGSESGNPRPTITFETNDSLSGVDYYKIKIGDGDFVSKLSEEIAKSNPYTLPIQSPGKHTWVVQAVDKAGNATTAVEEFVITALEAPFIDDYPKELSSGAPLIIRGRTYPSANVILWLQLDSEEPKSQSVRSDDAGNFIYISAQKLEDGTYKLWSETLNDYGARSNPSEVLGFVVRPATLFKIGSLTVNLLAVAVSIIALLAALIFIIWQVRRRFFIFGRNVNQEHKEVKKIEGDVYHTLVSLRAQIDQQAETLKQIKQSNPPAQEEKKQERQNNFNADNIHESGTGSG